MKLILALICIVCSATAITETLKQLRGSCIQSSKVDPQRITNIRSGIFDDSDSKEKEYTLCMFRQINFVSGFDSLNADIIIKELIATEDEAKALYNKCGVLKENILETVYHLYKCLVLTDAKKIPGTL